MVTAARVSAPASTANLGPLFDVAGMALDLRNEVVVTPGTGLVAVEGTGADSLPTDRTNLVARCFAQVAPELADEVDLRCVNRVPTARGLGSSTAAAACGLAAGWAARGETVDELELARLLTELDGHPDNAAPCALGGLVLVPPCGGDARLERSLRMEPPGDTDFVVVVPPYEVSTKRARAVLPDHLDRTAAIVQIGATVAVTAALAAGRAQAAAPELEADEVHERARGTLVPELEQIRAHVRTQQLPVFAVTLSGAGPTILAWCRRGSGDSVRDALGSALPDAAVWHLAPSPRGTSIDG
jgi:homoserine kinase